MPKERSKIKVTKDHISNVQDFMKTRVGKYTKVADIKNSIQLNSNLTPVSNWSIRNRLRNNLKFVYRKVDQVYRAQLTTNNLRKS